MTVSEYYFTYMYVNWKNRNLKKNLIIFRFQKNIMLFSFTSKTVKKNH